MGRTVALSFKKKPFYQTAKSVKNPGPEDPASEARRLAYLAAPCKGLALLPLTIMKSSGTKAQSFKNLYPLYFVGISVNRWFVSLTNKLPTIIG